MVNVRMDADDIAYLDLVGPTRSDAIRKAVVVCRRDHTVEAVRSTPVSISRRNDQRVAYTPPVSTFSTTTTVLVSSPPMPTIDPPTPPTAEYLAMKEKAIANATSHCPHPIAARFGRKPGPVYCGECGSEL
jgi:hypothetical protein